jgi:hypothetical protein
MTTASQVEQITVKGALQNSKYFTDITLTFIGDVSFQQVSDNVYIIRGYKPNDRKAHNWSCVAAIEGGLYHLFAYTKSETKIIASQQRIMHRFFKDKGLKPWYIRSDELQVITV